MKYLKENKSRVYIHFKQKVDVFQKVNFCDLGSIHKGGEMGDLKGGALKIFYTEKGGT